MSRPSMYFDLRSSQNSLRLKEILQWYESRHGAGTGDKYSVPPKLEEAEI